MDHGYRCLAGRRFRAPLARRTIAAAVVAVAIAFTGAAACRGGGSSAPARSGTPEASATALPARASSGCGAGASAGAETRTVTVAGVARTYRRYVPTGDAAKPLPVVINLHGLTSNIDQQVAISGFEELAAQERFIVLTPQGLGSPAQWNTSGGANNADLQFLTAMLDEVEAATCVDTARVYAAGLSDGGLMSATLACAMPDRIAAIGVVSGITQPDACNVGRPVPLIAFWGKKDLLLPYCGGIGPAVRAIARGDFAATPADPACPPASYDGFPPVEQVIGAWAQRDGCGAAPQLTQVAPDVERRAYPGCRDGSEVTLYSVIDGGHTWPGSKFMEAVSAAGVAIIGHTTDSIDATRLIWAFFERYALPS